MRINEYEHEFAQRIPDEIREGIIYLCLECNAVIHKCACGCGELVSTPIGKDDWTITYNGTGVTLAPSIGNWSYDCKSHYFIRNNKVVWSIPFMEPQAKRVLKKKWYDFLKIFVKK